MALEVGTLVARLRLEADQFRAELARAEREARASLDQQQRQMGRAGTRSGEEFGSNFRSRLNREMRRAGSEGGAEFESGLNSRLSGIKIGAGALGVGSLPAVATTLATVTAAVQQLAQAGLVLPGVMAGGAASLGTLKLGTSGLGDAIMDMWKAAESGDPKDLKKAAEALKDLSPNAKAAVTALGSTHGSFSKLKTLVQDNMFAGTDQGIKNLATKTLPTLNAGLDKTSRAWGSTFRELLRVGADSSTTSVLDRIFGNTADAQNRANQAIAPLIGAFGTLTAVGTDSLPRMADGLTTVSQRFEAFVSAAASDGRLATWIDEGIDGVSSLGATTLNLGKAITAITQAVGGGESLFAMLEEGSGTLEKFLNSADGQAKLEAFFEGGREQLQQWMPILESLPPLFIALYQAAHTFTSLVLPPLGVIASVLADHAGLVQTAATAWLLFRTVPALLGRVTGALAPVSTAAGTAGTRFQGASTGIRNFGEAYRQSITWMRQANPTLSAAGAHLQVLRANAATATTGGLNMLRSGASGLVGALGGPFSAALIGAGIAFTVISAKNQKATQSMEAYEQATKNVGKAQVALNEALMTSGGSSTDANVKNAGVERMQAYREQLEAEAKRTGSVWDRIWRRGDKEFFEKNGGVDTTDTSRARQIDLEAQAAKSAVAELDKLKMTQQSLADVTYGNQGAFDAMIAKLNASGDAGKRVAADMQTARREFEQQRTVAAKVTPGISELSRAMQVLGDKTATAADKSTALKAALDALNPARTVGDAIAAHDKVLQQVAESSQAAADRTKGFGAELLGIGGVVSTTTANGNALRDSLKAVVDASVEAASKGQPIAEVNTKNAEAFRQLAAQYGLTVEQVQQAYNTLGGKDINMVVRLAGAPEAVQKMAEVARAFEATPNAKSITLRTNDIAGVQENLRKLGFTVRDLPDGTTTITANTDDAKKRLTDIQRVITTDIPSDKPINVSTPGGQAVHDLLKSMGVEVTTNNDKTISVASPLAPGVLETLKQLGIEVKQNNDKTISVQQVGLDAIKTKFDSITNKTVTINTVTATGARLGMGAETVPATTGIGERADGAIAAMAGGGLRQISKPGRADLYAGRGAGTIFAEKETGGEAYIPLAGGKRARSTEILAEVARMFGLALVNPSNLLSFAEGGLRTASAINAFPRTGGLEGAPYKRGGVNWGDCSGAMSAIANFAVGLAPFASRFATMSEATELATRGFKTGRGPAGSLRFGWVNGGPGGGHTAGTLPDGTKVEMGGARGNGQVGGTAAGADDPLFTDHAYLELGDSGQTTGAEGIGGGSSATGADGGGPTGTGDGQRVYVTNWPGQLGGSDGGVKFSVFANGGIEDHTAHITDRLRVFGEPETGGEAYIPLAPGKRARSLEIWQQTGKRLGVNAFAGGGIAVPKIEAPKIAPQLGGLSLMPGGPIPIPTAQNPSVGGAPTVGLDPLAGLTGGQQSAVPGTGDTVSPQQQDIQRSIQMGGDLAKVGVQALKEIFFPSGLQSEQAENVLGLVKSVGQGISSSAEKKRSTSTTNTSPNGQRVSQTTNNFYVSSADEVVRAQRTKEGQDSLGYDGRFA